MGLRKITYNQRIDSLWFIKSMYRGEVVGKSMQFLESGRHIYKIKHTENNALAEKWNLEAHLTDRASKDTLSSAWLSSVIQW